MSWLDDRLAEQQAFRARREAMLEAAPQLYDALWEQISAHVQEAKEKGVKVTTNGAAYNRVVKAPYNRAMKVHLGNDRQRIEITGLGPMVICLNLDVHPDGIVGLILEDSPISVADAAIQILDRFLFPELPRK
jgi:hypothetical protein